MDMTVGNISYEWTKVHSSTISSTLFIITSPLDHTAAESMSDQGIALLMVNNMK